MRRIFGIALFTAASLGSGAASAACPSADAMDDLASDYAAMRPAKLEERPATMEDALCAQRMLVERLSAEAEPIGYKVGLTSKPAQKRFGASEPVRGRLLKGMIVRSGESIAPFAARGLFEADMLVTVRDDGINNATSPMEVLEHLESVQPFIELADLVLAEGQRMDPLAITAINVGARLGVAGDEIPVEASEEFLASLGEMTVRLSSDQGGEILAVPGKAILGHPLEAVLWLMNDGVKLEPGDVISLGSFGAPAPAVPGQTLTATYEGLPGDPEVSVTLTE